MRQNMIPTFHGACTSPEPKMNLPSGRTISGEANWPRYKAAESIGITVVADSLPPLIEAMVLI